MLLAQIDPQIAESHKVLATAPGPDSTDRFLLALARSLHRRGIPAHRLEAVLQWLGRRLGREMLVLATPTAVQLAFETNGSQRVHLLREEPGAVDLARICELNGLIDRVGRGEIGPAAAEGRLREIETARPSFGGGSITIAFAGASGSAACFFGGSNADILASSILALGVGGLSLVAAAKTPFGRVFEPVAAVLVVLIAAFAASFTPLSVDRVALSAVIALVPGFTLTVAMSELAVRHLASGVARLAGAAATFLSIGLGVGLGRQIATWLPPAIPAPEATHPSTVALAASIGVTAIAFLVLFQARRRDLPAILGASLIAFFGARGGSLLLGPELGVFVGATAVGLYSNALARLRELPATVPQVPGIMLLVPGSLGYRAVSLLLMKDVVSGVEATFQMLLVAVSLVGGLLAANVILPPKRDL